MKFKDLILLGLKNLSRRKARTSLTVIGVVIGIISIIVMVSIGIGINTTFTKQVMEEGSITVIHINTWASQYDEDGNWTGSTTQKLNDELIEKIKNIDHVKAISPKYEKFLRLTSGKYNGYANLIVMDCTTFEEFGMPALVSGEYPTKENNEMYIIGSGVMSNEFYNYSGNRYSSKAIDWTREKVLYTFSDYTVNENKKPFATTIKNFAVMEQTDNYEYDYYIYMDIDYYKSLYKQYANILKLEDRKKAVESLKTYDQIVINVDNMKNVTAVQEELKKLNVQSDSSMEYLQPILDTSKMLQAVLGAVGAIALLVSAINIANTMIMSIYERTREIGIMKVLGCKISDIRTMFLFEAGMLGLLGGIIGIGISYLLSWAINTYGGPLFETIMESTMFSADAGSFSIIPIWLPFASAGISILVGVVSGFFPALRATRISAIEAMKTDG